jgi:DNA-binding protein HU-beta
MNKGDLIDAVASSSSITKTQAAIIVSKVLEVITQSLTDGNNVTLVGFGTFKVAKRTARTGRNPRTGAEIKIPAKKSVSFVAGKGLKDTVNS